MLQNKQRQIVQSPHLLIYWEIPTTYNFHKEAKEYFNIASGALGSAIGDIFQRRKVAKAKDALIEAGASEEQANRTVKAAQADAVYKAFANFANNLARKKMS